ncbi:caspase-1-like isoform X2 [Rhodnius prolixus]|uniref:caspase-1-like isoform X2 n=1 Tax=Rhodnius prolixus TaxID=13249 RepID=UPI003D18A4AE
MDEEDKGRILINMPYLVSATNNFEHFVNLLIEKRVFNSFMVNKIKSYEGIVDKLKCLYEMIPKRGPEAFKRLTDALHESGNRDLALRLKSNRCINNNVDFNSQLQGDGICGSKENKLNSQRQNNNPDSLTEQQSENYPMRRLPRGHWIIINIEEFNGIILQDKRVGSLENVRKLKEIGEFFGFKVSLALNVNQQNFIEDFCKDGQPKNSVVLIVMSHGQKPGMLSANRLQSFAIEVVAEDGVTVSSDWIIDQFSAMNCKALAGKPKIIMFITCSGEDLIKDQAIQTDGKKFVSYPRNSDLMTVFSNFPGCQPIEYLWTKFLIEELSSVLVCNWRSKDVVTILQEVNRNLKSKSDAHLFLNFTSIGFDKKFYFTPVTEEERKQIFEMQAL